MNALSLAVCAGALALIPGVAGAWTAFNNLRVTPVSGSAFEVVGSQGSFNASYWCAAGDYARRILNVTTEQRIYVVRGRGPAETENRRSAVQFSLAAPEEVDTRAGWLLSVTRVGENLSAFSAWNLCIENRREIN